MPDQPLLGPHDRITCVGVTEHVAGHPVDLAVDPRSHRLVIEAYNRAPVRIDLLKLLAWLRTNLPSTVFRDEQAQG